jgi:hypothetical protein
MALCILRGISRVTAALTGLLLVYGVIYTMEGMTTRIPISPVHELGITTLVMLPWTLLFSSGVEDLGPVMRQAWIFWLGITLSLALLYYFELNTSTSVLTKAAMPLLATAAGLMPHIVRRINFVFTVFSFAAGIGGLVLFYFVVSDRVYGPSASSFSTRGVAITIVTFGVASVATGALSVATLRRRAKSS